MNALVQVSDNFAIYPVDAAYAEKIVGDKVIPGVDFIDEPRREPSLHDEILASQTDREVDQVRQKHLYKDINRFQSSAIAALARSNVSAALACFEWEMIAFAQYKQSQRQLAWTIGFAGLLFVALQSWALTVL